MHGTHNVKLTHYNKLHATHNIKYFSEGLFFRGINDPLSYLSCAQRHPVSNLLRYDFTVNFNIIF